MRMAHQHRHHHAVGAFSVTGPGTGDSQAAFAVANSSNNPQFVIQDNGNVGIGTTSPS